MPYKQHTYIASNYNRLLRRENSGSVLQFGQYHLPLRGNDYNK